MVKFNTGIKYNTGKEYNSLNEEHGSRVFEIKETVIVQCQKQGCNNKFANPSLAYCVEDKKGVYCLSCAKDYDDKELRIFVDMDEHPKTKIIKEFNKKPISEI